MDIASVYSERIGDRRYNTSYPLRPEDWSSYRVDRNLDFSDVKELSIYIHIPFCNRLCSFCEYTRMLTPGDELQKKYVAGLTHDFKEFVSQYPCMTLRGLDIGGGTPTALSDECFKDLLHAIDGIKSAYPLSDDFEPSIEATFDTIQCLKARAIADHGIKRISMGLQSANNEVLVRSGRINGSAIMMQDRMAMLRDEGIEKINIDFMYGLKGQSLDDVKNDLDIIAILSPEQVTLYEFRPNMVGPHNGDDNVPLADFYCKMYEGLTSLGYLAYYGQNTFTKDLRDKGLSSYLRSRMIDFVPYKGFGISAQSMSNHGISYNVGKGEKYIRDIISGFFKNGFGEKYTYCLPPEELLSKYIAVSGYYGRFSIHIASRILGRDYIMAHREALDFCIEEKLVELSNDEITLTHKGFENYGYVLSVLR